MAIIGFASAEFQTCLDSDKLQTAIDLYTNDFLQGFTLRNAALFNEWADAERERLYKQASSALLKLAQQQYTELALTDCQRTLKRLLNAEPWNEAAHRLLMQVLSDDGQRAAALKQYEICRALLLEELGVEPEAETTALFKRLSAEQKPIPHNLPPQTRPFIGRKQELDQLRRRLNRTDARLITIVGPGGIGKTSLALAAARQALQPKAGDLRFHDGIHYVALAEISRRVHGDQLLTAILTAIANALGLTFQGEARLDAQLLTYLADKQLLLIGDNVEHLLDHTYLLSTVLQAAPNVQIILTSRERVNLVEEWVLPLEGLPLPHSVSAETLLENDAVALFIQHAERTVGSFTLNDNTQDIVDVCRAVGGLPLGIELAASWLRVVPARQIASEVQKSFDFLSSAMRNRPERHRSLRAVFDSTWHLLNEMERNVLERLSIFRGSFTRDAAAVVADASLPMLISLNDKSLVNRLDENQYTLVEYIRQYVAELRHAKQEKDHQIRAAHLTYYARWLGGHTERLIGHDPHISIREIEAEQENVVTAWYWAVQRQDAEAVTCMYLPLTRYWRVKGTFVSALSFMQAALAAFSAETHPDLHAKLLLETALLHRGLSDTASAIDKLQQAAGLLPSRGQAETEAAVYLQLGRFQRDIGQVEDGLHNLHKARDIVVPTMKPLIRGQVLMQFGVLQRIETIEARTTGGLEQEQRSLHEEKAFFQAALKLFQENQHAQQEAIALEWLGTSLNDLGYLSDAERCYWDAIAIFKRIQLGYGLSSLYLNLVEIALAKSEIKQAIEHFRQGCQVAVLSKQRLRILYVVYMAGKLYQAQGRQDRAIVCLAFLVSRKGWVEVIRDYCRQQLAELSVQVSAETVSKATRQGNSATLDDMIEKIQHDFAII